MAIDVVNSPGSDPRYFGLERGRQNIISPTGKIDLEALQSAPYDNLIIQLTESPNMNLAQFTPQALVGVIHRVGSFITKFGERPDPQPNGAEFGRISYSHLAISNLLKQYLRDKSSTFPPEAIEALRGYYGSGNKEEHYLERENIGKLLVLDERNGQHGQSLGLRAQVASEIIDELFHNPGHEEAIRAQERRIGAFTLAAGKEATTHLMYTTFLFADHLSPNLLRVFGNALNFETLTATISDLVKIHPPIQPKMEQLYRQAGLNQGEEIFFDIGNFYQAVNLTDYGPYLELQGTDLEFLTSQLQERKRVLDIGCGNGRLLIPLLESGVPVEGMEVNGSTFESIWRTNPDAVLHIGSMSHLPFPDSSLDGAYLMGRTFMHERSVFDGIHTLASIRKVLRRDGVLLLDLPQTSQGEYFEYLKERQGVFSKLGIWNREAAIQDSPDATHFIDRLAPSEGQLKAMALLAGFNAEDIKRVPYLGASGRQATNVYWKLTPREEGKDFSAVELEIIQTYLRPYDLRQFGIQPPADKIKHGSPRFDIENF